MLVMLLQCLWIWVVLMTYIYRCVGNSQTKWDANDNDIASDLENAGKFSKKTIILKSDCY